MSCIANHARKRKLIDFPAVNTAALPYLPSLVRSWLPDGRRHGHEWVALNPRRHDRHAGSFTINIRSGKWADFATGDKGGDAISLAAYLFGTTQLEAALILSAALGVPR
jgi:hypothetical protein